MKKLSKYILALLVLSVAAATASAQTADKKPKAMVDESAAQDKTSQATPTVQMVPALKAIPLPEQPKPIVPGGDFKPVDTRVPPGNYKTPEPQLKAPAVPALTKQQAAS